MHFPAYRRDSRCRTMPSTPASGARAGDDGCKRRKGSKVHIAADTPGHLLALHMTPANEPERAQVGRLVKEIQETTGDQVKVAFVMPGCIYIVELYFQKSS